MSTFFVPLTSTSEHKLPPASDAARTALIDTPTQFITALAGGTKTITGVHEQPLGVGETQHGSETRRDNLLATLQIQTPKTLLSAFGSGWTLRGNEDSTLLLSARQE